MDINAVRQKAKDVILILNENGFGREAKHLIKAVAELEMNPVISLEIIIGMCHVRALGDLNIQSISYQEWESHLSKLTQKSQRALKQHDTNT